MAPLRCPADTVGDLIGSDTPIEDAISALAQRGCPNLTLSIDPVTFSDYPVEKGGYCDVYKGKMSNGTQIAVKSLRICAGPETTVDNENRKVLKRAAKEIYHWSKLRHCNVLPLLGLTIFRGYLAMVSEWAESGNLMAYRRRNPTMEWVRPCMDVCAGLDYIHAAGMVHGDLKAANVMVSSSGIAMITDFGNAQLKDLTLKFTNTTTNCGLSVRWAAPELLREDSGPQMTMEADVYAYGMVVLEVITGKVPYEGISDNRVLALVAYEHKQPPRPSTGMRDELWNILTSCWNQNPSSRPEASGVYNRLQVIAHLFSHVTSDSPTLCQTAQGDMINESLNQAGMSNRLVGQHKEGAGIALYSPGELNFERRDATRRLAVANGTIDPEVGSEGRPLAVESNTEQDICKMMRPKTGEHSISLPDQGANCSEARLLVPKPQTGHGYYTGNRLDAALATSLLGPGYYFAAPVCWHHDFLEQGIFCLSPNVNAVSSLDAELNHYEYPLLGSAHESVLRFQIGGLIYQWYTLSNTLGFVFETNPGTQQLLPVMLFKDLEAAQVMAQQLQEQSRHFNAAASPKVHATAVTPNYPPFNIHEEKLDEVPLLHKAIGVNSQLPPPSVSKIVDFSQTFQDSPRTPADYPASPGIPEHRAPGLLGNSRIHSPPEPREPPGALQGATGGFETSAKGRGSARATKPPKAPNGQFFGANRNKGDIDNWVDQVPEMRPLSKTRKCPEAGCHRSFRRPRNLKHYRIPKELPSKTFPLNDCAADRLIATKCQACRPVRYARRYPRYLTERCKCDEEWLAFLESGLYKFTTWGEALTDTNTERSICQRPEWDAEHAPQQAPPVVSSQAMHVST